MKTHFVYIGLHLWSCYRRPRQAGGIVGFGNSMKQAYADLINQEVNAHKRTA